MIFTLLYLIIIIIIDRFDLQNLEDKMDEHIQNALQKIGNQGKFQQILIAFLFCMLAEVNLILVGPTFIYMNPLFSCSFTPDIVDQSIACDRIAECSICKNIVYKENNFTLVASSKIYCQNQFSRNFIQSIPSIGGIFGLLIINYISDKKGRIYTIILAQSINIIGTALNLAGGFMDSIPLILCSQFICGFSRYSTMIISYIIPGQFGDEKYKQKANIIVNYAWAMTSVLIGILYYYYNLWYNFLLYISLIPMIIFLIFSIIFLVESPYYYYQKQQFTNYLHSMEIIAKYNNTLAQFQQYKAQFQLQRQQIDKAAEEKLKQKIQQKQQVTVLSIIKSSKYVKTIIILTVFEIGSNLTYQSSNYAISSIGYSYGLNMIINGLIQLAAYLFTNYLVTKLTSKQSIILFSAIIVCSGLLFFIPVFQNNQIVQTIVLGVIRFCVSIIYVFSMIILSNYFPIEVQGICSGIIEVIAQSGTFVGPLVITLCINLQIYPMIVISFIVLILTLLPSLKLQEKEKKNLLKPLKQSWPKDQNCINDSQSQQ